MNCKVTAGVLCFGQVGDDDSPCLSPRAGTDIPAQS